jgi:uncharacterized membrane protein YkoI
MNRYKRLNSRFLQCGLIILMLSTGMLPLNSSHAAPSGITLQQAAEKAVQQFGGEVVKSEVNKQNGTPVYVIRLLTKGRVKEVLINSQNGKVISPDKE